jgi:tripartite-type tricarboxylate transporter receptor subunit TctC
MSKKNITITLIVIVVLVIALAIAWPYISAEKESVYPSRDITLIVPWNAGGSSDLIGRLLVAEMEKTLGVTVTVVNTPGATGTVGMNDAFSAPHDGYTLIANATPYSHYIMGLADWKPSDWDYFAAYYCPGIIAVQKDQPYKTFPELFEAIKANPDTITGGTAGVGSSGFTNMEILKSVAPELGNYKHIAYTGGAAAITATLSREVVFTPQLSNEMIDLLRAGDLIALAALTPEDLTIEGVDYTIPSIKNFIPETADLLPCGDAFGLMFPSDIPQDAKDKLEAAYLKACESDAAKAFAKEKGVILEALNLEESNALRDRTASVTGWTLYEAGVAPKSPADIGIPKP